MLSAKARLRWFLLFIMLGLWSQPLWALNCPEARQLTLLYFKMHYSYNSFDAELGQRTLDNFIKMWDPAKVYFYESDVKEFRDKYSGKLHTMINQIDCSAIDFVMNRYSKRFEERQNYLYKLIEMDHDFTKDEYLTIDAKKLDYAKTNEEINDRWRKRIKFQLLTLKTSLDDIKKAREKLKKRYDLARKLHNNLTKDKVLGVFMNAFSTALDPHSSYMPADDLEDFRIRTRLSLEGIGASLKSEDGFTIVVSLVKGGAAEKSGLLKINDKIIAVAQGDSEPVDVIDMDLQDVVKLIRGARGTVVKLTVLREEGSKTEKKIVPITREKIQLVDQQASSHIVEMELAEKGVKRKYKVGVINLPSFYIDFEGRHKRLKDYRSSSQDTIREIEKLKKEKVEAIVMDLRNNGGGSLEESINMAGLFFEKGPVVQVKGQSGSPETYYDRDGDTFYDGPLVVMINRHSASASEIFAGAIQDYGRGIIVGDSHTFGKGTVQNLNDVAAKLGAVKVTVNKFYRPSGASTQLKGVSSDIRLPSLVDEFEIGEKYYDYALPFETIASVKHKEFNRVQPYVKKLAERSSVRLQKDKFFTELNTEIEKYRKNAEERSRVSLKENKDDKDKKTKDEEEEPVDSSGGSFNLVDDSYLQETLKITSDYLQLLKNQPFGDVVIPVVAEAEAKEKDKQKVKVSEANKKDHLAPENATTDKTLVK